MFDRKKNQANPRPSWREYQAAMRPAPKKIKPRHIAIAGICLAVLFFSFYMGFSAEATAPERDKTNALQSLSPTTPDDLISKKDVQLLLDGMSVNSLTDKHLTVPIKGHEFALETSLDPALQAQLIKGLDRKNSRYIGIVVMDADTGRILSLVGFNKTDPDINPCLQSTFPAASIFKIVTAAAAVDHCGYNPDTRLTFNGYKHTLYKRQLKDQVNQYTNTLTFKDSFAQSVNPVFGKIGSLRLGQTVLEQYAASFGFNQDIDFELLVPPSHVHIDDDPYHWAEIASGFNNDTTLSPIHAAMMVSAVLNKGRMLAPTIVETLADENGKVLYRSKSASYSLAMTSRAAFQVARMMKVTVAAGTGRKIFRGAGRDRILSNLDIGGKTGSIYNRAHDIRFDWFVGFAENKRGDGRIAVAVLVGHQEYIGIRAGQYARMAMTYYFSNPIAHNKNRADNSNG